MASREKERERGEGVCRRKGMAKEGRCEGEERRSGRRGRTGVEN